jgi:hypothetical protein
MFMIEVEKREEYSRNTSAVSYRPENEAAASERKEVLVLLGSHQPID